MTDSKKAKVLEAIKNLTREYGRVYFGIDDVSKASGVPKIELWDWDNDRGILQDLSDDCCICIERGREPDVALDEMVKC